MLTLNFAEFGQMGSEFYIARNDLIVTPVRFSTLGSELPYIMAANPEVHKKGMLHYAAGNIYSRRGINMIHLKDIVERSPVPIRVKLLSSYYLVGKGFIARIENDNSTHHINKIELLFIVAAEKGKGISSPHDLKIYLNRQMYEPQYKRIMSFLKTDMAEHKGDIVVTKSINNYLLYQFALPKFTEIEDRVKFDDNMKQLFIRSIKWIKWRKDEDERIERELRERQARIAVREREIGIQNGILAVLEAEELRIAPTPTPIIEVEAVEELPGGELQPEMVVSMREEQVIPQEDLSTEIHGTLQNRQFIPSIHQQSPISQFQQEQQQPLSHGQVQEIPPLEQEILQSEETQDLQQPQEPISLDMTQSEEQQSQPRLNSEAESMTEEEMLRIMNQFSIASPVTVEYTVRTDPATGIVLPDVEDEIEEMEIDENTEVLLQEDDDIVGDTMEVSEDDLDDDPDAYEDAVIVDSSPSRERVFSAMEGGTDGG